MLKTVTCKKRSFTLKPEINSRLLWFKNKSLIVNNALELYFKKQDYLIKAESNFWEDQIKNSENDYKNWDFFEINTNWELITDELLEENLWSKIWK